MSRDKQMLLDFAEAFEKAYNQKCAEIYFGKKSRYLSHSSYHLAFDSYGYRLGARAVLVNATASAFPVKVPREDGRWDPIEVDGMKFGWYVTSFEAAMLKLDPKFEEAVYEILEKMLSLPQIDVALPGIGDRPDFQVVPSEILLKRVIAG